LESGVGEGVLPLLGSEEAGHRTRLRVERHVDEALEYLERELGTDRRGGERAQPLTEHEPPPGGEARQGLVESVGQVSREVEDVDAPDEGERPRSDSLAGPGLVDVEREERERQTGTQGAETALGTAAEEGDWLGERVRGDAVQRATFDEGVDQRLGSAPQPAADLEHRGSLPGDPRRRDPGRHPIGERVVAVRVAEVRAPEGNPLEERPLAARLPACDARIDGRGLVEEGIRRGIGGVAGKTLVTQLGERRRRERSRQPICDALSYEQPRRHEPLQQPAKGQAEDRGEAALAEEIVDTPALGKWAIEAQPFDQLEGEVEDVPLDELAATVLARIEDVVGEAGLGQDDVEARVWGGDADGHRLTS